MKERPIIFSAPMVHAILAGQKTQTRRVVKPEGADHLFPFLDLPGNPTGEWAWCGSSHLVSKHIHCPYGQPGDRLWVKETWQYYDWNEEGEPCIRYAADNATAWPDPAPEDWVGRLGDVWEELSRDENFKVDGRARDRKWRPSIFMFKWASRIQLEVVSVRVERLQDISEADAIAEGSRLWADEQDTPARDTPGGETRLIYRQLWESINGAGSWDKNPWVWVVEFKRIKPPKNKG